HDLTTIDVLRHRAHGLPHEAVGEHQFHTDEDQNADDDDQDPLLGQGEAEDRNRLDVAAGEELVAAAEDEDHGVLQHQRDAECRQHPGFRWGAHDALHHEPADDHGDDRGRDHA